MTSMLIDTNVLVDVIEARQPWEAWAVSVIAEAIVSGNKLVLSPIVYAEASTPYEDALAFDDALQVSGLDREDLPWAAAFLAAKAHLAYRNRGGPRLTTLPDFLIAAHAQVQNYHLITRDAARFRTYFPNLELITPETHPVGEKP
jgi:predicted nucleic acid-binding protein